MRDCSVCVLALEIQLSVILISPPPPPTRYKLVRGIKWVDEVSTQINIPPSLPPLPVVSILRSRGGGGGGGGGGTRDAPSRPCSPLPVVSILRSRGGGGGGGEHQGCTI